MYRTQKTTFRANQNTIDELIYLQKVCGQIWNDCIQLSRYYYRLGQKWITKTQLQEELKGKYPSHSQTIQAVCHKYIEAREGTFQARQKGYKNRYPYKMKRFFNPKWVDKAFTIEGNTIYLSFGNLKGLDGKRKKPLQITVPSLPNGDIKSVEIIYDRNLQVCLSYEDGIKPQMVKKGHTVGVDVGEIHSISAVSENEEALIVTGRKMRSIHHFRNQKVKELQQLMSKCEKHSRKWKKYNKAKRYILSKSEKQLRDVLHKTTKQFVEWCVQNNTKHVVVGDVEGVQRNKKKKRSKKVNRKISNWSFGKLYAYLEYKLKAKGISFEKIDESFTSQTCPVCGNRKKISTRNYKCKCGYKKHRDLHGASNILSKYLYDGFMVEMETKHHTYLRPVY